MKQPRYFCEFCNTEVKRNSKICPSCGHFFSSVKCPRCGFSGDARKFTRGCPVCGYSAHRGSSEKDDLGDFEIITLGEGKTPHTSIKALPFWVYLITGALLLAVALMLFLVRG